MIRPRPAERRSARITLERRPSDFEADGRVVPFTGSCCSCCCCLHWIGGLVGGIVGARMGWEAAVKQSGASPHPIVRRQLILGIVLGSVLSVLLLVAAGFAAGYGHGIGEGVLIAAALLPSLIVLPIGASMVLASYGLKWRVLRAFQRESKKLPPRDGTASTTSLYRLKQAPALKTRDELLQVSVFCPTCWCDLESSLHLPACPECGAAITRPIFETPDYGRRIALRVTAMSFVISTAGIVLGYLLMVIVAQAF